MELRQLRYFVAVAEELHFGRAATRLHLAQPALSRQVRNLEDELGVQLLQRTKRRVQLTAAGTVMLDQSRSVLARVNEAVQATTLAARGRVGWLGIGFVGSATYDVLPASLKLFRQRAPGVEITLSEMTTSEQIRALREKRIHLGLARPPVTGADGLAVEIVAHEAMVVALPRGHRLGGRRAIPLRALADEGFILYPRETHGGYFVQLCRRAGFDPKVVQETVEVQTATSLVAAGVGISLVAASVGNMPRRGVVYRPLTRPAVNIELMVLYRQDDIAPVLHDFIAVLRNVIRSSSGG